MLPPKTIETINTEIINILIQNVYTRSFKNGDSGLNSATQLKELDGIIDSIEYVELIMVIEDYYNIEIQDDDIENISDVTIEYLSKLVQKELNNVKK